MLPVDVVATVCLIDRFNLTTRYALKGPCVSDHVTKPDVLAKHPIKLFFVVSLRHRSRVFSSIVRNCEILQPFHI